ncbi:MAG: AAA family ATPase [Candidatus Desulforudis sp.]|nr:AAA family ATPase [Desulforudis sp.]
MGLQIAVAGKGGGGKTTFAVLTVRSLVAAGHVPVLAVDADANANLAEVLGVPVRETIADVLAELSRDRRARPGGMSKAEYVNFRMNQALAGSADVDLLVMGTPEGPGCYCHANNLLREFIEQKAREYAFVVVDNEAGLEHLSRGTIRRADLLFIVSDASVRGLRSAGRIHRLARQLKLGVGELCLVINRVKEKDLDVLGAEIAATRLELAGYLPHDPAVEVQDLQGKPLIQLPEETPAVTAVRGIISRTVFSR